MDELSQDGQKCPDNCSELVTRAYSLPSGRHHSAPTS